MTQIDYLNVPIKSREVSNSGFDSNEWMCGRPFSCTDGADGVRRPIVLLRMFDL